MPPVKIKLEKHYAGDTWSGIAVGPVSINEMQPINPLSSVRMQFRNFNKELGYEFNTVADPEKGLIVISNADSWEFQIEPQFLKLGAGRWKWDIECTDDQDNVITLYYGCLTVKEDITYD